MNQVDFEVNGQKINGMYFPAQSAISENPALIFIHGSDSYFKESYQKRAEELSKFGFLTFGFDLRGHGKSEGKTDELSPQDYLADAIAAYDHVANMPGVNKELIGVIGASFGGYLAALLCNERKLKWLAMRAPANFSDNDFSKKGNLSVLKVENGANAINAVGQFKGDVLIVESEKDDVIPHDIIQSYMDAISDKSKLTHAVLNGMAHYLKNEEEQMEYQNILNDFFKAKIIKGQ